MARCPECDGSCDILGLYGDGKCSHCHGSGKDWFSSINEGITGASIECVYCNGSTTCQHCGGDGVIAEEDDNEYSLLENNSSSSCNNCSDSNVTFSSETQHDLEEDSDDTEDSIPYSDHISLNNNNATDSYYLRTPIPIHNIPSISTARSLTHKVDHRSVIKKDHRKKHR